MIDTSDDQTEGLEWHEPDIPYGEDGTGEFIDREHIRREKVYVNGVDVSVL